METTAAEQQHEHEELLKQEAVKKAQARARWRGFAARSTRTIGVPWYPQGVFNAKVLPPGKTDGPSAPAVFSSPWRRGGGPRAAAAA